MRGRTGWCLNVDFAAHVVELDQVFVSAVTVITVNVTAAVTVCHLLMFRGRHARHVVFLPHPVVVVRNDRGGVGGDGGRATADRARPGTPEPVRHRVVHGRTGGVDRVIGRRFRFHVATWVRRDRTGPASAVLLPSPRPFGRQRLLVGNAPGGAVGPLLLLLLLLLQLTFRLVLTRFHAGIYVSRVVTHSAAARRGAVAVRIAGAGRVAASPGAVLLLLVVVVLMTAAVAAVVVAVAVVVVVGRGRRVAAVDHLLISATASAHGPDSCGHRLYTNTTAVDVVVQTLCDIVAVVTAARVRHFVLFLRTLIRLARSSCPANVHPAGSDFELSHLDGLRLMLLLLTMMKSTTAG